MGGEPMSVYDFTDKELELIYEFVDAQFEKEEPE